MPILSSRTHWQALQAETQAKACRRVCLSYSEKKYLKIFFSSNNFKNVNSQNDIKKIKLLVAAPNSDKSCELCITKMPACNSVNVAIEGEVIKRKSVHLLNLVLNGQVSTSNPLLYIYTNHYE
ncbi:MAG TPA: hypothetical protein DFI01_08695 [Bacteroidales bacterium]|nr:hypothetical protein [Bacteroidales bacterium]